MSAKEIPQLKGQADEAVNYRGGHMQIIASAGSGKTEVVSQRVADLLVDGYSPTSIVAFTFTERAAASLKSRIEDRVAARLNEDFLDRLNGMFVGTIHSYCFRILQLHVPTYETYDVLDEHRLTAFLTRIGNTIEVKRLEKTLFKSVRAFMRNLDIVENELLHPDQLEDPFRDIYERYRTALQNHRFLTYGQIIAQTVEALANPDVFQRTHDPLRHLIVDEYQDINPAQEALIERLSQLPVHLCVVGDDDQSIYQWRGADVTNILEFQTKYPKVKQFTVATNRRSRPEIIGRANEFGGTIEGRLPKTMKPSRQPSAKQEVICWTAPTEPDQARVMAKAIRSAHDHNGYRYRDIAVLCRSRTSLPEVLIALDAQGIPVQPTGRTNLFFTEEADLFGRTMAWLVDDTWFADRFNLYDWAQEKVTLGHLISRYTDQFSLSPSQVRAVKAHLRSWKASVEDDRKPANLVRDFYELLRALGVDEWDLSDAVTINRLGTLARCSQVLADYESTRRRARPDHLQPGVMRGGQDRGHWYYLMLSIYMRNWAQGAYEGFEGEEDVTLDAVDVTTVHQAKGLEWPIVFVPSLTASRFPSKGNGKSRNWHVSSDLFSPERYDGTVNDERRLFYVAMTRARDVLHLSSFLRTEKKAANPSPFLLEVAGPPLPNLKKLPAPPVPEVDPGEDLALEITFSDLAAYLECGLSYRLRRLVGFQPPIAPEIGYGKAVHHVLRRIADHVRKAPQDPYSETTRAPLR